MNQVAKKKETALAVIDNSIFEADAHAGLDNVAQEDLALPFLKVLSQLSPELESVEGAKAGMIYNTVSGQVFDGTQGIKVVPCHYERKYIEWTPRGQGSGAPVAVHPATSDIMTKTFRKPGESKDYLDNGNYVETSAQHYVLILDEEGNATPALIVMKATQHLPTICYPYHHVRPAQTLSYQLLLMLFLFSLLLGSWLSFLVSYARLIFALKPV